MDACERALRDAAAGLPGPGAAATDAARRAAVGAVAPSPAGAPRRPRRAWLPVAGLAAVAAATAAIVWLAPRGRDASAPGGTTRTATAPAPVPGWSLRLLVPSRDVPGPAGRPVSSRELGGRYVVLGFWAPRCVPCRTDERAWREIAATGVRVVVVRVDEWRRASAGDRRDAASLGPAVLADARGAAARAYRITGVPETVVLDPDGRVVLAVRAPLNLADRARIAQVTGASSALRPPTRRAAPSDVLATQRVGPWTVWPAGAPGPPTPGPSSAMREAPMLGIRCAGTPRCRRVSVAVWPSRGYTPVRAVVAGHRVRLSRAPGASYWEATVSDPWMGAAMRIAARRAGGDPPWRGSTAIAARVSVTLRGPGGGVVGATRLVPLGPGWG